ncbi:MAG: Mrp/NBP35 family ATP-binding protein [Proteobacteria bacterium]|nr:Mrp/NBP35 family ATP-binding protein [Pseudomonadota bacterium]
MSENEDIIKIARNALLALATGDLQESDVEANALASRIIGTELGASGTRIRIMSDGFSLDKKMKIEKTISKALAHANLSIAGINFAKGSRSTTGEATPSPAKLRLNPFGLNIDKRAIPGVRNVILVASGKGGVGKSTVSTNLAVALKSKGLRVGLMDCDVYGPSAPILMGIRGHLQVGTGGKLLPLEGHGVKVVSFGFLTDARSPVIWRGPLVSKAIEQFCYDVAWGDLDVLVVDMPPGTGDVQLTIAEKLPVHGTIIVTTPQDVALVDAHKAISMFEKLEIPIAGVVENMAWHTCTRCGNKEDIFGAKAFEEFLKSRQLPLLTRVPLLRDIRLKSDAGTPPALDSTSDFGQPFHVLADTLGNLLHLSFNNNGPTGLV